MTKDEIKKALELCSKDEDCEKCPYVDNYCCTKSLQKGALALITEQERKIERLKAENEQSRRSGILGNNVTVEFHDDVVSEQSEQSVDYNDIEKYAKQFSNRIIYINEKEVKQAQIDVLNKLKRIMTAYSWQIGINDVQKEINELIKEIQNEQKD